MYALQAETEGGGVVGFYICDEEDRIIKAWQNPLFIKLGIQAILTKYIAPKPVALYDYGTELASHFGLKVIPVYLVKTFGRFSTEYIGEQHASRPDS
jgi:hypothetical protein